MPLDLITQTDVTISSRVEPVLAHFQSALLTALVAHLVSSPEPGTLPYYYHKAMLIHYIAPALENSRLYWRDLEAPALEKCFVLERW